MIILDYMYVCFDFVYHISKLCGFFERHFWFVCQLTHNFHIHNYTHTAPPLQKLHSHSSSIHINSSLHFHSSICLHSTFILQLASILHFTSILYLHYSHSWTYFALVWHTLPSCSPLNRQLLRQQYV